MRRRLPALLGAVLVACSTLALGMVGVTTASAAVTDPADIEIRADAATGKVGDQIFLKLHVVNHGPGNVATGWMTYDYQAPVGTELVGLATLPSGPVDPFPFVCTWPAAKTHARCILQWNLFYQMGDHGLADYGLYLALRVVRPVTAPGRFGLSCTDPQCKDPKTSNNSAKIVVNGVSSTVKPSPSASRSVSPSATPDTTSSGSAAASAAPLASAVDPAATPDLRTVAQTGAGTTVALLGGLAVVVMAACGGAVWYRRSRRPVA